MANQADIDRLKAAIDKCADAIREIGAALVPILTDPVPVPVPVPTPTPGGRVLWQDNIQTEADWLKWGPNFFPVVESGGANLGGLGSDARGASLSRVRDPAGGAGWAIRHYLNPAIFGRAQYSMASWTNSAFGAQAAKGEVWIEQEMFFPALPVCNGSGWVSLMDFHSHTSTGTNWWNTNPGLMLASADTRATPAQAGSLVARDKLNLTLSPPSPMKVPVGRWFKLLTHFIWSTTAQPTTFYIDGVEAAKVSSITKAPDHTQLEWMSKLYGVGNWSPSPLIHYTRNVKIADGFIR